MTWHPTGKIRYRPGRYFGRRKLILQLEERRLVIASRFGDTEVETRWRDAATEDLPIDTRETVNVRDPA